MVYDLTQQLINKFEEKFEGVTSKYFTREIGQYRSEHDDKVRKIDARAMNILDRISKSFFSENTSIFLKKIVALERCAKTKNSEANMYQKMLDHIVFRLGDMVSDSIKEGIGIEHELLERMKKKMMEIAEAEEKKREATMKKRESEVEKREADIQKREADIQKREAEMEKRESEMGEREEGASLILNLTH